MTIAEGTREGTGRVTRWRSWLGDPAVAFTVIALTTGVVHVANWVGSHVLALIAKKGNQNIALITYEVSTDGQTLTARTSGFIEQVVIFKRREL